MIDWTKQWELHAPSFKEGTIIDIVIHARKKLCFQNRPNFKTT
jgi:hypothetical protein